MKKFNEISSNEKHVLQIIYFSFMDKFEGFKNRENEQNAYSAVSQMDVKKLKFKKSLFKKEAICHIELDRPGIIIGRKGEMIKYIEQKLLDEFRYPVKLKLYDSKINTWLYSTSIFEI